MCPGVVTNQYEIRGDILFSTGGRPAQIHCLFPHPGWAATPCNCARLCAPQAWYREGKAAQALGNWEDAACAFFEGHCVAPDNADLEVCFKFAVQEGKKVSKSGGT